LNRKICLIGDFGVGKTSLIRRFVDQQFSDKYLSTVGTKISRKLVEVSSFVNQEKKNIQLLIWDIEGKSKFQSITPKYLRGAMGAIIVADLSRPKTMENIKEHLDLFSRVNPQAKAITVNLNKVDLLEKDQAEEFIQNYNFQNLPEITDIYLTSAKTGKNVDKMFQKLAFKLL
jgi:small GTP-binding protein